ncbi:MAG: lactate utilization protein [Clostridia bacterium]|nr:lactate utilization protein [Clostridia bacterium]
MQFETVRKSLEARGYRVSVFGTKAEATAYLDGKIDGKTVGFGGSVTLREMGIYEALSTHNETFWHWAVPENCTAAEMREKGAKAQIYLSSVNGLSQTGEIVNIDGTCNRVSAMLYGHETVYLVAGKNKLAPTLDAALHRARNIAAPKNAQRLGMKTPCAANADKCYDCQSPERICKALSVLWGKPTGGDFEVVLIDEEIGY